MKRVIAIVEDEAAIRDNYAAAFEREGYSVRIRRKFQAVDPKFDAVQTAYGMGYRWAE